MQPLSNFFALEVMFSFGPNEIDFVHSKLLRLLLDISGEAGAEADGEDEEG